MQPIEERVPAGPRQTESGGVLFPAVQRLGGADDRRRAAAASARASSAATGKGAVMRERSLRRPPAKPVLIDLRGQVLPAGALRMDMALHIVVGTDGLRTTTQSPALALRRSKPAYIDMQAGDLVETLYHTVLSALARANRLGPEFLAGFDSKSVQLLPTSATHSIALDRAGSRKLWQYFATEIMEGVEVKLQLQLTPPRPVHARGHEVDSEDVKALKAKAAKRSAKDRAIRLSKVPHPPTEPRGGVARVDRLDTVAARVVNRVQAVVEQKQRFDEEQAEVVSKVEDAMLALDRVNERRVAVQQQRLSQFAFKPKPDKKAGKTLLKSGRDLAAAVNKNYYVVEGFVPLQKTSSMLKEQEKAVQHAKQKATQRKDKSVHHHANATINTVQKTFAAFAKEAEKEDDIRPVMEEKKLGFAGLGRHLQPKVHKSRVRVELRKNVDMSKEGAKVLTAEEKLERQSDQISFVLNNMIDGKRKLYGSMMRDARSAFAAIDKDGNGSLDYQEFGAFLTRLGLGLKQAQMDELARAMDTSGDGEIDCDEFVAALEAAAKRGKEEEEEERRHLDAENENIRATIAAHNSAAEPTLELTEIEKMRARIAKTKRSRKQTSLDLAQGIARQGIALSNAAGFPQHFPVITPISPPLSLASLTERSPRPVKFSTRSCVIHVRDPRSCVIHEQSSGGPLRVNLPGTHGVTVAIGTTWARPDWADSEPEPEPEPEQSVLESSMMRSSGFTSGDIAAFTATDYIEAIDDMDAEEVTGALEHWGIGTENVADVDAMRARLRQHYLALHGGGEQASESEVVADVPEEETGCAVDADDDEDDAAVPMSEHVEENVGSVLESTGGVSVAEEVPAEEGELAVPEEAVQSAMQKVYEGMDVEKQAAAVASALNLVEDSEDDEGEEGEEASEVDEDEVADEQQADEEGEEEAVEDNDTAAVDGSDDEEETEVDETEEEDGGPGEGNEEEEAVDDEDADPDDDDDDDDDGDTDPSHLPPSVGVEPEAGGEGKPQ